VPTGLAVIELPIRDGNEKRLEELNEKMRVIELPIRDGNMGAVIAQ